MNSALFNPRPPGPIGEDWVEELEGLAAPETVVRRGELLARRTTLRVGGPADPYLEPVSESDLSAVVRYCAARHIPFFLLGRGSNLLARDGGYRGVVICLAHPRFGRVEVAGTRLRCGAGARLKAVAMEARRQGLQAWSSWRGYPEASAARSA